MFLPKINDELMVVKLKGTNHIQLVNIFTQKVVRQFTLTKDEFNFKVSKKKEEPVHEEPK